MTHFEYISVAVALILAIVVGHALRGLNASLDKSRRYWVQTCWTLQVLASTMMFWWGFWEYRDVEWTSLGFCTALAVPAILYVRAIAICGDNPALVDSFRTQFFTRRARFFAIGLIGDLVSCISPWVLGQLQWFDFDTMHLAMLPWILVDFIGFITSKARAHEILAGIAVALAAAALAVQWY